MEKPRIAAVLLVMCRFRTEFLHDLLVRHLASLLLLPLCCLRGGVAVWGWQWLDDRPRVHLMQQTEERFSLRTKLKVNQIPSQIHNVFFFFQICMYSD